MKDILFRIIFLIPMVLFPLYVIFYDFPFIVIPEYISTFFSKFFLLYPFMISAAIASVFTLIASIVTLKKGEKTNLFKLIFAFILSLLVTIGIWSLLDYGSVVLIIGKFMVASFIGAIATSPILVLVIKATISDSINKMVSKRAQVAIQHLKKNQKVLEHIGSITEIKVKSDKFKNDLTNFAEIHTHAWGEKGDIEVIITVKSENNKSWLVEDCYFKNVG